MKVLQIYEKITNFVFYILDIFCRAAILMMTALVVLQVVLRAIFKINIPWVEEVVLLAMVWMTFAAMAIGVKEEAHIRIDFFMARFPMVIRKAIVIFGDVVLLLVNIAMIYYGIQLIQFTKISLMPVTQLPSSAVFYLIPIASVAACLALIGKLLGLYKTRSVNNFISGTYEEESLKED